MNLKALPELSFETGRTPSVRIPELRNVPLPDRVAAVVDHPAFQRLRRVRMLGPSHLVYPGATHTRFEHSLGVFGHVRRFLLSVLDVPAFADATSEEDLLTVLAAGLLHDLGHYPFAHSLEALHLKGQDTPRHEEVGGRILRGEVDELRGDQPIAEILRGRWGGNPDRGIRLCTGDLGDGPSQMDSILHSLISGTIDADKMDYLRRDSHHIGVPYGRTFDKERLLDHLTLSHDERALAIGAKAKVSAEMFVFARYTMFSEVYWHHTVRSAGAMVENALAAFHSRTSPDDQDLLSPLLRFDDEAFLGWLRDQMPLQSATGLLVSGLCDGRRSLYKRIATYSRAYVEREKQEAYNTIYAMDRATLSDLTARLTARIGTLVGRPLHPASVIIDIPPRDKDRLETIEVIYPGVSGQAHYQLHELSRVVAGIQDDFISVVKKIRIYVAPEIADDLRPEEDLQRRLLREILS